MQASTVFLIMWLTDRLIKFYHFRVDPPFSLQQKFFPELYYTSGSHCLARNVIGDIENAILRMAKASVKRSSSFKGRSITLITVGS